MSKDTKTNKPTKEDMAKAESIVGQCSCHEMYTSRQKKDPYCSWHLHGEEIMEALADQRQELTNPVAVNDLITEWFEKRFGYWESDGSVILHENDLSELEEILSAETYVLWPTPQQIEKAAQDNADGEPPRAGGFKEGIEWLKANTKTVSVERLQEYLKACEAECEAAQGIRGANYMKMQKELEAWTEARAARLKLKEGL